MATYGYNEITPKDGATIIDVNGTLNATNLTIASADVATENFVNSVAGQYYSTVSAYSASVTYADGDSVYYYDIQFISLQGSNTGNSPLTSPTYWLPIQDKYGAYLAFTNGKPVVHGIHPTDDIRSGSYKQWMKFGQYSFGAKNFQVWKVHLDGTVVTGDVDLENILDPGGAAEYRFIDTFAPDVAGTRTLLNYTGRVSRCIDSTLSGAISNTQEDAFQAFQVGAANDTSGAINYYSSIGARDTNYSSTGAAAGLSPVYMTTSSQGVAQKTIPMNDGTNGTPRMAIETRVKSYTEGVPAILVFKEI